MVLPIQYGWDNIIRGVYDWSHSEQLVYPTGTATITLASDAVPDTLGAFSADFIASGEIALPFALHWVDIGQPNINANYTIIFYAGSGDTEVSQVFFQRFNATNISHTKPLQSEILAPGSRVRAKMMDSTGGGSCTAKILVHQYDHIYSL